MRDHKFPSEEAVYKLLYRESEKQEGRAEAKEVLEGMLQEQYAPVHRLLHKVLDSIGGWDSFLADARLRAIQ